MDEFLLNLLQDGHFSFILVLDYGSSSIRNESRFRIIVLTGLPVITPVLTSFLIDILCVQFCFYLLLLCLIILQGFLFLVGNLCMYF